MVAAFRRKPGIVPNTFLKWHSPDLFPITSLLPEIFFCPNEPAPQREITRDLCLYL